jgi:hypothetical protein
MDYVSDRPAIDRRSLDVLHRAALLLPREDLAIATWIAGCMLSRRNRGLPLMPETVP